MSRAGLRRQLSKNFSEGAKISAVEGEQFGRRFVERQQDFVSCLDAARREDHELDPTIGRDRATLGQAQALETIDHPGCVRGIGPPRRRQRPHRIAGDGVQRVQGLGVVRRQRKSLERLVTVAAGADEEIEEPAPGVRREGVLARSPTDRHRLSLQVVEIQFKWPYYGTY